MSKNATFPTVECTVECTVELPLSWQDIGIEAVLLIWPFFVQSAQKMWFCLCTKVNLGQYDRTAETTQRGTVTAQKHMSAQGEICFSSAS